MAIEGISQKKAAAVLGMDLQALKILEKKGLVIRFDDGSVDIEATQDAISQAGAGAGAGAKKVEASLRGGLRGVDKAAKKTRARKAKRREGDEFLPEDLKSDSVTIESRPRKLIAAAIQGAPVALQNLEPGGCVAGICKGQFSAWELLAAGLTITGPADVDICTWTTNSEAISDVRRMLDTGLIKSVRVVLDKSLKGREPEYHAHIVRDLGNERIRTTRNHAKWIVLTNEKWNLVIRGSANFGAAPRLEYFEASDDLKLAAFLRGVTDELFERAPVWNWQHDGDGVQFSAPAVADHVPERGDRLTQEEIALEFHITTNKVTRLRTAGLLTFDDDGCTTLDRARAELREAGRASAGGSVVGPDGELPEGQIEIGEARRRECVAKAEKAEIEVEKMRGELIPRAMAEAVYSSVVAEIKANIEALPNRAGPLLLNQTDAVVVRRILQSAVEDALRGVSEQAPEVSE